MLLSLSLLTAMAWIFCDRRDKGPAPWQRNQIWINVPFFLLTLFPVCLLAVKVDEQKLMDAILADYTTAARPVYNASQKVTVKFGLTLTQISDMDEVNQVLTINVWLEQEWEDERLTWDPKDFNGLTILRIPCEKIWLPDIVLYNSADDFTTGYMKSKAMVTNDGNVFWPPPAKFRSSCKIDITYFPFDDQVCELKFGSWTYDGFQVDLTNRSDKVDLTNYVFSGEWELIDVRVRRTEMIYACCEEPYPDVRFTIIIRRKTLYYLFNIIFPCLWLTILSLLGFWLPPDSGEKITLGITVLLAFSVFMLLIAESMPATSEFVPLIGIYLTVTMAMTSLSIILTVFVLQLHHVGPHQKRVPRWMWTLVLDILAPIVCLCHVSQRYRYLSAKLNKSDHSLQHQGAAPRRKEEEDIGLSTMSADTTPSLAGGRGRGNCNGIVLTGSGSPGVAGGQSGLASGGRGSSSGVRNSGNFRRDRPRSGVSDRGSGSYISAVASSSIHAAVSPSNHEDPCSLQVGNSSEPPSRPRAPARRDPPWSPAEYVTCRPNSQGYVELPQRVRPAPSDSAVNSPGARLGATERDGDSLVLSSVSAPATNPARGSATPMEDVTHPKLVDLHEEGVRETSLASRGFSLTPDLPPEKLRAKPTSNTAESPGRIQGHAPPSYQPRHAQQATSGSAGRDYHVTSGSPAQDRRYHSRRAEGGEYQKEQITQHLEVLVSRDNEDDYHQDVVMEWRVVAHVMDRLLFWLFLLVAIVSSVIILIIKPLTKPETWRED